MTVRALTPIHHPLSSLFLPLPTPQQSFFAQFCAGEDEATIQPTLARLAQAGVGSILDYAAESDVPTSSAQPAAGKGAGAHPAAPSPSGSSAPSSPSTSSAATRSFSSSSTSSSTSSAPDPHDAELDSNLEHSILGVHAARDAGGFAAVKLTSLARPELLQTVSTALHANRRAFRALCSATNGSCPGGPDDVPVNPYVEAKVQEDDFVSFVHRTRPNVSVDLARRVFRTLDTQRDGAIDYLEWTDAASLLTLGDRHTAGMMEELALGVSGGDGSRLARVLGLSDEPVISTSSSSSSPPGQAADMRGQWEAARRRALKLAQAAADSRVTIMVDAEQTYLQPAIDSMTTSLQRRFNRPLESSRSWQEPLALHLQALASGGAGDAGAAAAQSDAPQWMRAWPYADPRSAATRNMRYGSGEAGASAAASAAGRRSTVPQGPYPVVYNTLQAYLRDMPSRLSLSLSRARRERYLYGAKLVRGAYMVQERARAKQLGYNDPIHADIAATHACYDDSLDALLGAAKEGWAEVMVASHNESSITRAVLRMRELGLDPSTGGVSFGQLLGMCDYLSFSLGAARYSVHKYVPYGPVFEVMPYLIRRAQENSDVLGGVGKEIRMLERELTRRMAVGGKGK
jgi:hypothetical protein